MRGKSLDGACVERREGNVGRRGAGLLSRAFLFPRWIVWRDT